MNRIYVARSNAVASRILGGEMVIMSAADSTLFVLNEVATEIWLAADGRTPLTEIVDRKVCEEFDVDPAAAYSDAEEFVNRLADHGVLKTSEQPITDSGQSAAETP